MPDSEPVCPQKLTSAPRLISSLSVLVEPWAIAAKMGVPNGVSPFGFAPQSSSSLMCSSSRGTSIAERRGVWPDCNHAIVEAQIQGRDAPKVLQIQL